MTRYITSIFISRKKIQNKYSVINAYIQEILCLTHRLIIQAKRRPASIVSNLIQPLLWLILFGALFKDMPLNLFHTKHKYSHFLSCGIIVFTCFTGSLNAGLPLIFDREFGFLNRLLVTPIKSKNTIFFACIVFIACITTIQNFMMITLGLKSFIHVINTFNLLIIIVLNILLTMTISSISIGMAFMVPGHIEFLAFIIMVNLPTLFASTALAPLYLMPYWMQTVAKFNILTYAIETLRFIIINNNHSLFVIEVFGKNLYLTEVFSLLILLNILSFITINYFINNKLE